VTRISAYTSPSVVSLGIALCASVGAHAEDLLPTYAALYEVSYRGHSVGSSEISIRYDGEREIYMFRSQTEARGLLRLLRPNPVVERSEFAFVDGQIRPLEVWFEDGSRKGDDNLHATFDWASGVATFEGEETERVELQPGVLDRGSMQAAVMRDMAVSTMPGPYALAENGAIRTYEYSFDGDDVTNVPLGEFATQRYVQQRPGSSRSLLVWAAPELRYLPVRIEQIRDGKTETVLELASVAGLDESQEPEATTAQAN
jgi:Protein of unknown function (DUF3108)